MRRSFIAGEPRMELVDALSLADQLITLGCFTEIIQWRKRVFVPTGVSAAGVLGAVIGVLG
ncbi:MAG: hypothetical protein RMX65_018610 [Nostoc sp. DedQUE01]